MTRFVPATKWAAKNPNPPGWVPVGKLLDTDAVPPDAARVVIQAIALMLTRGEITHRWQALEMWAADYLSQ